MKFQLSYKRKCSLLAIVYVIFLLNPIRVSLGDTFELKENVEKTENKIAWMKEKEKELPAIKEKLHELELALAGNDSIIVRDALTAFVSDFAEKNACTVVEIPTGSIFHDNGLKVQTNSFMLKGNYNKLLILLFRLEREFRFVSRIMSVKFFTVQDHSRKEKELYLNIITQSFRPQIK